MPITVVGSGPVPILATFARLAKRFRRTLLAQIWLLLAALFMVLGAVAFRLAEPWPLKFIFDGLLGAGSTGIDALDRLDSSDSVTALIVVFIAIVLAHTGLTFLSKLAMAVAFRRMLAQVRRTIFAHLLHMSILSHHRYGAGDLANRLTVDIDRLRLAGTNNAVNLAVNVLTMVGMLAVMVWVNWQLALIALLSLPLFHLLTRQLMPLITENSRRFRASDGALSSKAVDTVGSVETVQGMSLYDVSGREFERGSERNLLLGTRSTILKTVLRQAVTVLFAVCIGLLVWRGATLAGTGAITPGDLIIFMAYLREGMEKPMIRFSANLAEIGRGAASGERLLALLDEPPEPDDRPDARADAPSKGAIGFQNVSFRYPGGPLVLNRVNLTIAPGERVAIVGSSGSGKSTLIALLLRLYEPESGCITVDGVDIRDYRLAALRRGIATVFQESAIFGASVRDNLTLGNGETTDRHLDEALRITGADDFVGMLDAGLETHLPARGKTLSGGQRQRLGIARAVLRNAPILLLDEPTSALDPESRTEVERALRTPTRPASVLLITHQREGLDAFDRIYELRDGTLHRVLEPAVSVA